MTRAQFFKRSRVFLLTQTNEEEDDGLSYRAFPSAEGASELETTQPLTDVALRSGPGLPGATNNAKARQDDTPSDQPCPITEMGSSDMINRSLSSRKSLHFIYGTQSMKGGYDPRNVRHSVDSRGFSCMPPNGRCPPERWSSASQRSLASSCYSRTAYRKFFSIPLTDCPPTYMRHIRTSLPWLAVLAEQPWMTSLLLCLPLGFASHWFHWPAALRFTLNFLSIVPQAWLMGRATEDLATHLGEISGGLLNAWFGNVVEMLLCVAGLRAVMIQGELALVKATLVGSILSNLLLVTGSSLFFGGLKHKVQEFSLLGASTNASLMTLSCLCLGLPTMYATLGTADLDSELKISRSVSVLLMLVYFQYLVFQMGTHGCLMTSTEELDSCGDARYGVLRASSTEQPQAPLPPGSDQLGEPREAPQILSWAQATGILFVSTLICAASTEFLIASIKGTVETSGLSKRFIGIILLPIIGNAAEHYTSVIVAMRNKMDLALACAVGSSCQMALFVTPCTVIIGWALGQPMSLNVQPFEMTALFLSVLVLTSILQDGYSNWLEGSMLTLAYCVIALIYFFHE